MTGENTLIGGPKSEDKNLVEKKIVSQKMSEDTIEPSAVATSVETKIATLPVPTTIQPLVDDNDCKNIKCVSTQLCVKPVSRKRRNTMFDPI